MKYLKTFFRILKRIKSRPNRYFALLIITIIGLFMLAYMHNYNIVYLMMFFTFSFAAASSLMGRLNLDPLEVRVLSHERLFALHLSHCRVALHNNAERIVYAIECAMGESTHITPRIEPGASAITSFTLNFKRRGETALSDLRISSYFPLPYEQFYTFVPLKKKMLIYPEPKGITLEEYYVKNPSMIGERDDFEGLRSYESGDAISLIHWPSLAGGNELMSKQFSHTHESAILRFDFQRCAADDEARLSQLCLWVLECEKHQIPFIITMPHEQLHSNTVSTDEVLSILARY